MRLIVVHYHWRAGGVRRVVEIGLPALVARLRPKVRSVVMASGEAPDDAWAGKIERSLGGTEVRWSVIPAFRYSVEQTGSPENLRRRVVRGVAKLLKPAGRDDTVIWAHNLSLGRNLPLAGELTKRAEAQGMRLLLHHHDFWFDQRAGRWLEIERALGIGPRRPGTAAGPGDIRQHSHSAISHQSSTISNSVARAILPAGRRVGHIVLTRTVERVLAASFGRRCAWVPNPVADVEPAKPACRAMGKVLGSDAPVWLMPVRVLRRKNIAEALLLTRWLRPEAWLATTGDATSPAEAGYARRLESAAAAHGWQLRLGILARTANETRSPTMTEVIAAAEAIVVTSLQEGFGYPMIEAAAGRRPLVCRRLAHVASDLAKFGFTFPHCYDELRISKRLFGWPAELRRQRMMFARWIEELPRNWRPRAAEPSWWHDNTAVPFSRLTLAAQLEVLAEPPARSWRQSESLNAWLAKLRVRARDGRLAVPPWPAAANRWLSGRAFAGRVVRLLTAINEAPLPRPGACEAAHAELLASAVQAEDFFPLLAGDDA